MTKTRKYQPRNPTAEQSALKDASLLPLSASEVYIDDGIPFVKLTHGFWELDIHTRDEAFVEQLPRTYVLTLPAAAQLARDLESAVQEYLYGGDEETE